MTKLLTANEFVVLLKQQMTLPDNITNIEITASVHTQPVELRITCRLDEGTGKGVIEALRAYKLTLVGERCGVTGPAPAPFNGGDDVEG